MNIKEKTLLKHHIKEYYELYFPHSKPNEKNLIKCPLKCSDDFTAHFVQNQLKCYNPQCQGVGDIFNLARVLRPNLKELSDSDIGEIIAHKLKIQFTNETDDLVKRYSDAGFALIPLSPNSKIPLKGQTEWQNTEYRNSTVWADWIERGYNIGLNLGKVSNVVAVDIDDVATHERVKHLLGETLCQKTGKGWHYIYNYDPAFTKTINKVVRDSGYEMELRTDKSYIVIAPSVAYEGDIRQWNDSKIIDMPKELKEFFMAYYQKEQAVVTPDEEIQNAIDEEIVPLADLSHKRNNTFVKLAGILRKKLNLSQTEYVLNLISNNLIDKPIETRELRAIISQMKKYHTYDKAELAKQVLDRLEIIGEGSAFQIAKTLNYEQKDIEEVMKHLLDEEQVVSLGKNRYKSLEKVLWEDDFTQMGAPIDFEVPYFSKYAYFDKGDMIVVGGRTGAGKCFAKGTKILMFDGTLKEVEKIQIGDKVMGIDSTPRTVLGLDNGIDELYDIIPTKGKKFTVNSRHILSLKKTGTNETINIGLDEYKQKNTRFKYLHKLYRVPVEFPAQSLSIDPYFLGLWLGDGDSTDSRITNINPEVISALKDYGNELNLQYVEYAYSNRCPSHKLSSRGQTNGSRFNLLAELRNLNVLHNKHIPAQFKINSKENRLKLLAGLLDSDGYYSHGYFEIITKFDALADDIEFLAGSLGFLVTRKIKSVKYKNKIKKYWKLAIIGEVSNIPTKILYKQAPKRKINKNPLYTGFKIQSVGKGEFYGFELDGDHLHLIDSFIVNHNTHITANILRKFVEQGITPYLISTEAGSKIGKICGQIGLKPGDFKFKTIKSPTSIELEDNAVTIIDWLKPDNSDYAKTDQTFEKLKDQLIKHKGLLIVLVQIRKTNGEFFAQDQIDFYSALTARYCYKQDGDKLDMENTYFETSKIRDSKTGLQQIIIPMKFDKLTKKLEAADD